MAADSIKNIQNVCIGVELKLVINGEVGIEPLL